MEQESLDPWCIKYIPDIVQPYMYYVCYHKGKKQLLYIYCEADSV